MSTEMGIRMNSSRDARKYVREVLDELGYNNDFSVTECGFSSSCGKKKKVTIKNCYDGFPEEEIRNELNDRLGVEVEFEFREKYDTENMVIDLISS